MVRSINQRREESNVLAVHLREELHNPSRVEALGTVAKASSGVFRSPLAREKRPELRRVIVATVANYPYVSQLNNFACWLKRKEMHAMVFSLDNRTHSYVQERYGDGRSPQQGTKSDMSSLLHSYDW